MHKYTDGTQIVEAALFEDTHRSAHYVFNLINDVRIDALVAPARAIDYIMNNERITMRNQEVACYGEYVVKYPNKECKVFTAALFNAEFTKVEA